MYGEDAIVCRPAQGYLPGMVVFACRSIFVGIRIGLKGGRIHLGDASLVPLGAIIHVLTGAHVTVTVAGLDVLYPAWWYQFLLRHSLKHMHRVCCISHATADVVRAKGIGVEKIVIIPCGVWMHDLPDDDNHVDQADHVILSIARLVPRKGIAWFVDQVFPLLLEKYPQLQYNIIGDGPERKVIKKIIVERGLEKFVHLLGEVDDVERERELQHSRCLIVPNIKVENNMEGFGIVCIEASGRGIPVVSSRLEGLQDAVIEGQTGAFFDQGNASDAASVIEKMLTSPMNHDRIRRVTAERFDWPQLFSRYRTDVFN